MLFLPPQSVWTNPIGSVWTEASAANPNSELVTERQEQELSQFLEGLIEIQYEITKNAADSPVIEFFKDKFVESIGSLFWG